MLNNKSSIDINGDSLTGAACDARLNGATREKMARLANKGLEETFSMFWSGFLLTSAFLRPDLLRVCFDGQYFWCLRIRSDRLDILIYTLLNQLLIMKVSRRPQTSSIFSSSKQVIMKF